MNIFIKSLQSTKFKVLIQLDYYYIKQNVVIVNIIIINALLADTVHEQAGAGPSSILELSFCGGRLIFLLVKIHL